MTAKYSNSELKKAIIKSLEWYNQNSRGVDNGSLESSFAEEILVLLVAHLKAAQLEILMGFRRRDFVNQDMYQAAVIDRIAKFKAESEQV